MGVGKRKRLLLGIPGLCLSFLHAAHTSARSLAVQLIFIYRCNLAGTRLCHATHACRERCLVLASPRGGAMGPGRPKGSVERKLTDPEVRMVLETLVIPEDPLHHCCGSVS